ncbi:hypothetical protein AQJ43_20310 [Streptomyces avermitilis]|nr:MULTISPECIES: DUF5819 family protein [Streptomyces]KUN52852.1 hypothetical protein AQJ43_20310 [Streptomyces avermitilis]OOV31837.1 hypothetical protein SM007_02710 [Streptomyces avermitilis]BBJ52360.1 hypothetical protein SAVMC3_49890 [Streptomyces avermitilis]GDY64396.1 hypothetical protein SAV14893_037890 [Streptomyces avermitilis]GDY75439.1 hypothetical protein SAV31267_049240 [Streptomyces avermitilis]
MDVYDEGSDPRQESGGPDGPVPDRPDGSAQNAPDDPSPSGPSGPGGREPASADRGAPVMPATSVAPVTPAGEPGPHQVTALPDAYAVPRTGIAALSLRYQIAAALALAVVAVAGCVHVAMVFLHVAPSNTVTKQHGRAIDDWIYPEFEQNWKLFAPNPLQQNIAVQVRAEVRTEDGSHRTTGWYDLSALDGAAIDGNLLPSHTQQNELRRAWDFYLATHDNENRPAGMRGDLSQRYLRSIVGLRLEREHAAGRGEAVERVQVRSSTTNVQPPRWSNEKVSDKPMYRVLPWWPVPTDSGTGANA